MTKKCLKSTDQEKNVLLEVSLGLEKIYGDLVALNKEIQASYDRISGFSNKGRTSYVTE